MAAVIKNGRSIASSLSEAKLFTTFSKLASNPSFRTANEILRRYAHSLRCPASVSKTNIHPAIFCQHLNSSLKPSQDFIGKDMQIERCLKAPNSNFHPLILPSTNMGFHKECLLPATIRPGNMLKLTLPSLANQEKLDPLVHRWTVEEPRNRPIIKKHAIRMLIIRKKKMRKHKLKKLRKRMRIVWARERLNREIRKEKAFQAELMAQIKAAEAFDAEEYVKGVLRKIKEAPRPETREERNERIKDLIRKNRSHVNLVMPKLE